MKKIVVALLLVGQSAFGQIPLIPRIVESLDAKVLRQTKEEAAFYSTQIAPPKGDPIDVEWLLASGRGDDYVNRIQIRIFGLSTSRGLGWVVGFATSAGATCLGLDEERLSRFNDWYQKAATNRADTGEGIHTYEDDGFRYVEQITESNGVTSLLSDFRTSRTSREGWANYCVVESAPTTN